MNYYIQGNAAKADQIKAAFEKLGYSTSLHTFFDEDTVFITLNGNICECNYGGAINELIKTHPDYKELELPVEPKFKVGDTICWINHDVQNQTITDIKDDSYITVDKYGIKCALKFTKQDEWELIPQIPHYDIANFKPKQWVLVRNCDNQTWCLSIFSHIDMGFYVCINLEDFKQCIPLEGNEKLLDTTDMPSEEYINW